MEGGTSNCIIKGCPSWVDGGAGGVGSGIADGLE